MGNKQYEFILFDWDGVFVKTPDIWIDSVSRVSKEFNLALTPSQIRLACADFSSAVAHGLAEKDLDSYVNRIWELGNPKVSMAPMYPGAATMLKKLKAAGKTMAIVSSRTYNAIEDIERNGLSMYFKFVLYAKDVEKKKPHPEGLLKAIDRLGAAKQSTIFVGDAWTDIKAANSAGIDSVLYYPASHSKFYDIKELMSYGPTYVAKSHAAIAKLLM